MQPTIFMSVDFFVRFCKMLTNWNSITIDKKWLIMLEELIFEKGKVYLNIPAEEIKRLLELNQNREEFLKCDEDTRLLINYLFKLSSINSPIRNCKEAIQIFRTQQFDKYDTMHKKPDFLFLSDTAEYCKELSEKFGIFCISNDIHLDIRNSRVSLKVLDRGEPVGDNDLNFLPKSNSLVIEDPYILNNNNDNFLDYLLEHFYPKKLAISKFFLTIIYTPQMGLSTDNIRKRLESKYSQLQLDFVEKTDLHDRNIYSNTFWISCDYGFRRIYTKPTKWEAFPLATYYSQYKKRLMAATKSSDFKKLDNPLVLLN